MPADLEPIRIAIVGAGSLLGKELKRWIEEEGSLPAELRLLDEELLAGTLTEAGGEAALIGNVDEESFKGTRVAFFTGSRDFSKRHVGQALRAGAAVIDLSGGLGKVPGGEYRIPSLDAALAPVAGKVLPVQSGGLYLSPSVPAIIAAALTAAYAPLGMERLVLTFLRPVSECGQEGIEELGGQVVKLLSFERISQKVFDAQVGFNLLMRYGSESQENLDDVRRGIIGEIRAYSNGRMPIPAITLIQAPVFYSYAFSCYAEFRQPPNLERVANHLEGGGLKVAAAEDPPPDNINVVGESRPVLARPERDPANEAGVWVWGTADNLRVAVANAFAIAGKLLAA
jgi:aspartate-semialdehyde dehydrogenase